MRQVNDPVWKLDSGNSSGGVLQKNSGNSVYSWLTILSGHKAGISRMRIIGINIMSDSILRHQQGLTSTIQVTADKGATKLGSGATKAERSASTIGRSASRVGTTY